MNPAGSERGFNLVQVTVLVAVVAILAAAAVPLALRALEQTEERLARAQLERVETALLDFYKDKGRLPSAAEGLEALMVDPGTGRWHGPYLQQTDAGTALTDPRGQALAYTPGGTGATIGAPSFASMQRNVRPAPVDQRFRVRALAELKQIGAAALEFRSDYGGLPGEIGSIVPAYLGGDYALDPWGSEYLLDVSAGTVTSLGSDRAAGGGDDLTSSIGATGGVPEGSGVPEPPPFVRVDPADRVASRDAAWASYREYQSLARLQDRRTAEGIEMFYTYDGLSYYHYYRWYSLR